MSIDEIRFLEDRFAQLGPSESYWARRQQLLMSKGYTLRPRYRPDWVPSWKRDPKTSIFDADDRHSVPVKSMTLLHCHLHPYDVLLQPGRPHLMDATRISDGKLVMIKKVAKDSQEVRIATYFSSEHLRKDPRNHCVPVFDVLDDPEDPSISFMVMPFLRRIHDVEFDTVGSIFDCVEQLLEVCSVVCWSESPHTHHAF